MFDRKYGKVLTIVLVIAIIAIVALLIFFGCQVYKKNKDKREANAAIEDFDREHGIDSDASPQVWQTPDASDSGEIPDIIQNDQGNVNTGTSTDSNGKTTINGFTMAGYIEIPSTKVKVPILDQVSMKSLETAVVILYSTTGGKLNAPGNVVIAGHNYRNSTMFSNNKKLKAGDKIYITDENGKKIVYTVYDNFEASPEDTSFYKRDTGGVPEITLSTCTSDSSKRTIILARA